MVKEIVCDIFKAPIDVAAHQCNCFHTMGSGIAKVIREKFPEAYKADKETRYGDINKLGTFSFAKVKSEENAQLKYIVNIYSQFNFGRDKRYTNYEAVANGLASLRDRILSQSKGHWVLGIPWRYGCNVAGGDWLVVEAIIQSVFRDSPLQVIICRHPEATYLNQKILSTPSKKD